MALAAWRQFTFFDTIPIRDPQDDGPLYSDSSVSAVCGGSGSMFLGTTGGMVKMVSKTLKPTMMFMAHEGVRITHLKQIDGFPYLLTVAESDGIEPQVKLWALDKYERKMNALKCLNTFALHTKKQHKISVVTQSEDFSLIAFGLENGTVILVRGDIIHEKYAKQKVLYEGSEPITGLAFYEVGRTVLLYIGTTTRILTVFTNGKNLGSPARVLEEKGCSKGCMALKKETGEIIVARDDAIYFYTPYDRGPVYAYDGPKTSIYVWKNYLAIVSPPQMPTDVGVQSALKRFVGTSSEDPFDTTKFSILDTENKFVAYTGQFVDGIKAIFSEWGDLYVLGGDGQLYRHQERELQVKVDILFQRNLYNLALTIALSAGAEEMRVLKIYKKYGDYLYEKGDFDEAMTQYIKAISGGEASQVIRKYLDSQRIYNLTSYLEELHNRGMATADHTTLLLNCYAKLKDTEKLETFIRSEDENLKFDLDTAIQMCRQGGYYQQAAYLAERHGQNDLVVDITLQDLGNFKTGLSYIRSLPAREAYINMIRYGRALLDHVPSETTSLFIEYFTGKYHPRRSKSYVNGGYDKVNRTENQDPPRSTSPQSGLQTYKSFIPYVNGSRPASVISGAPIDSSASIMSSITGSGGKSTNGGMGTAIVSDQPTTSSDYTPPKPRTVFAIFVDKPREFIVFLEACITQHRIVGGSEANESDLYTALFEMYLQEAENCASEVEKESWENKARDLIIGFKAPIDPSNVLLLSHLMSYRDGRILVRERENLYIDIFRSSVAVNDTATVIQVLHKYGDDEPELFRLALSYFTSTPEVMEAAGDELNYVLQKIQEDGLMAPLQVIQALSMNAVATIGVVKEYLTDIVQRERSEIETNRRLTESYRLETKAKQDEIYELRNEPRVFQSTRCASCGAPLDLPTVHFMCKHSYHRRCLNEVSEDTECPQCAPNNATIRAIRRAQDDLADRHDLFRSSLEEADDKFKLISDFLGRGVMEQVDLLV
ncbi:uncharacterized protein V1510DRAFT_156370 [Dipodascopsis tothii]|uniref:uncharacterized protein n=1 Tax=Dipodascopsis tothii TaxID=44089 RepID=UPI0034CF0F5B